MLSEVTIPFQNFKIYFMLLFPPYKFKNELVIAYKKYCCDFYWVIVNFITFSKISIFITLIFSYKPWYASSISLGIYGGDLLAAVYNFIHIVLYGPYSIYALDIYDLWMGCSFTINFLIRYHWCIEKLLIFICWSFI